MIMKKRILVVDDQETTITLLIRILNPEYDVITAKSGQEGILIAEKELPDIILLDILMLDLDGYTVLSMLKSSELTKNIPVIFITSLNDAADEEKGLALGASDYITKPFSPAIVKLRIQNQIRIIEHLNTIEKLSKIDQLTDLPNRRCFEGQITSEWGRASRDNTPISILMIDIDYFKKYNDNFGHLQGDVALKAVAMAFKKILKRPSDFAARWGGEEFVILLPNTNESGAIGIAEQVRKGIEEMEIPSDDALAAKVTVSIGVNTQSHEDEQSHTNTIYDFVSKADKALYDAKNKGRNRSCSFVD